MSVSSINSTDLSSLYATDSVASTTSPGSADSLLSPDSTSTSSSTSDATSTSVSKKAKLLDQLKDLASSDPAEFKKVTADIATQLQAAAQQTGGSAGNALSSLAAKFQQASQTGSISSLEPAKHHHGGHKGAAASASAAYQQGGASAASGTGSQIDSIISQVLSQDTADSGDTGATNNVAHVIGLNPAA